MSDEVSLEGEKYISSKRASELSGYAQDYIGQLARKGLIDAKRMGGLWYVSLDSLNGYKSKAAEYKPELPTASQQGASDPESMISFDGRQYVSASRAAKSTGYHQDYVGQLARSGKILSRQIGNRWYVDKEAIESHKQEKDALLGAVQAQSVGIVRPSSFGAREEERSEEPFFTYISEEKKDLLPNLGPSEDQKSSHEAGFRADETFEHQIPIHVVRKSGLDWHGGGRAHPSNVRHKRPASRFLATAALTLVVVTSLGFISLETNAIYGGGGSGVAKNIMMAQLASIGNTTEFLRGFTEWVEGVLALDITYSKK